MALNPTATPTHAPATSSAASALAGARATGKSLRASADDDSGGFAAELQRAQPAKPADAQADGSADEVKPTSARKESDDDTPATAADPNAAAATAAQPTAVSTPPAAPAEQNALQWAQQQLAAAQAARGDGKTTATAALASDGKSDAADLGKGLAALRKGAAPSGKGLPGDVMGMTSVAGKTAAASAKSGAEAGADQGLGAGSGASNSATGTRDSLAAFLPQPDATVTVAAGTVGASPTALLDSGAAAPSAPAPTPAQATLPMAPQSPAFAPALGQQIEVWMRDGVQHAEVQLNPLDLGPIRVRIAVEGAATRVEMHADVASTRDALQQALPQLSDSLGQVGLSLSGGGVSDQPGAQSQSQAQSAFADGGQGGSGRPGATRSRLDSAGGVADGGVPGAASGARQALQRRGLLDLYA
jgi:flagellar hook-length control protein FliK